MAQRLANCNIACAALSDCSNAGRTTVHGMRARIKSGSLFVEARPMGSWHGSDELQAHDDIQVRDQQAG